MQRKIAFRAWVGKMEYDIIVGKFGAFYVNAGAKGDGLDEKDTACLTSFNTKYSEQVPIMQFTGLKDKNGMEIYEGDILDGYLYNQMGSYSPKKCSVFWNVNRAEFACEVPGDDETCWSIGKNCSVLGNIYENPELLK